MKILAIVAAMFLVACSERPNSIHSEPTSQYRGEEGDCVIIKVDDRKGMVTLKLRHDRYIVRYADPYEGYNETVFKNFELKDCP